MWGPNQVTSKSAGELLRLRFSADQTILATLSAKDHTLRVYRLQDQMLLGELPNSVHDVQTIQFSPDGKPLMLARGSDGGPLREGASRAEFWDIDSQSRLQRAIPDVNA